MKPGTPEQQFQIMFAVLAMEAGVSAKRMARIFEDKHRMLAAITYWNAMQTFRDEIIEKQP